MLSIRIPLWENNESVSSKIPLFGQEYIVFLNKLDPKSDNQPSYELVLKPSTKGNGNG
jgi:hypothetical protein